MRNRTRSLVPAVILTLASLGSSIPISYARSTSNFGPAVDTACQGFNGTTPYADQSCALCHNTSNLGRRVDPQWGWWETGNLTAFCPAAPPTANQAPNGTIDPPRVNQTITVGQSVAFGGTGSDSDGQIASYLWNFDGGADNSTQQNPGSVQFNTAGTFTVSLTVTDDRGLSDPTPAIRTITVQAPTPANRPPNGTISTPAANLAVTVGESLTFRGAGSDPDGDPITSFSWNWNFDGGAPNSTQQNPGSVRFSIPGVFTVVLTVTDAHGLSDPTPDSVRITVNGTSAAACTDADGDGFAVDGGFCGPEDCDDTNQAINPGAKEVCADALDNDCDFFIDDTDSECDGSDCIGRLINGEDGTPAPTRLIEVSFEADRDPAMTLDGASVSGNIYVFVAPEPGIRRMRYFLDNLLNQTENYAPWDFAGGSSGAANAFDTARLGNGAHGIRAEIDFEDGETVTIDAQFIVDNGLDLTIDIDSAIWDPREQELEVKGSWPTLGAQVKVSNAITGASLGTTIVEGDDDGSSDDSPDNNGPVWLFQRERPATVPCRVRVEIEGQFGERDVANAPADCDGGGTTPPEPENRQPTANDDAVTTDEDTAVAIDALANDSDPDGDTLSVTSVTQGSQGSVQIAGSTLRYTPNANASGSDTFSYTVADGNGETDTAIVRVTIRPVNDPPVAADDAATTDAGVAVTVDVLANDSDVDGDVLTIIMANQPAHGGVTNDGMVVRYTSDAGFSGVDTFTYTLSDGNGGSATATVSVTVRGGTGTFEVEIEEATWRRFRRLLIVEGEDAPSGSSVTLLNASTRGLLGRTTAEGDGDWEVRVSGPSPVPCRIRVEVRNGNQLGVAERDVRRAPSDCR